MSDTEGVTVYNPVNCPTVICLPCIAVLSSFGRETSLVNIMGPQPVLPPLLHLQFTSCFYFELQLLLSFYLVCRRYVPNISIISACSMHVLCDFAMFCLKFHTLLLHAVPRGLLASLWVPSTPALRLYLALGVETPNIDIFSANSPLYRRHRRFKIGVVWRSC